MKGHTMLGFRRAVPMLALLAMLAGFASMPARSADPKAPKAERFSNVTWYVINDVRFKPNHQHHALGIVRKYFMPAGRKAGNAPVMVLVHRTGAWDVTVIWKMQDGIDDMNWKMSPDGVKFMQALSDEAGGMDKAHKIMDNFDNDIAMEKTEIAMQEPGLR